MASSEAQAELINSLSQDEIPAKLRCAICSKLAVDAFRLPCCEQAICASCQSTLPSACPVCEHSPLSAEDCKPHKALRTTIKVFLRTAEKKREPHKAKDASPSATPTEAHAPQLPTPITASAPEASAEPQTTEVTRGDDTGHGDVTSHSKPAEDDKFVDNDGPSNLANGSPEDETEGASGEATGQQLMQGGGEGETATFEDVDETNENEQNDDAGDGKPQDGAAGGDFGFGNMFPNMNFGGAGFDQMQMMMNGMAPNGFGNFPMMGMPGMNMDPMTMQMMMNGGFQGMGMNGMNMMGMGGFGGEANNNWNGQQSWNVGQDNFNHPNAASMGNGGDFGSFNAGFQTGYNQQGNYGHQNQYNDNGRPYGFRGRGRGRGGYGYGRGRGGYNQGFGGYGNYQDQNFTGQQHGSPGSTGQAQGGQDGDRPATSANVDEFGRQLRQGSSQAEAQGDSAEGPRDDGAGDQAKGEAGGPSAGQPIQSLDSQRETGDAVSGGGPQGQAHDHNEGDGFAGPPPAPDVPINAPKGPKAMLQGLPNTSFRHLQARGWVNGAKAPTPASANGRATSSPTVEQPRSRSSSPRKQDSQHHREGSQERQDTAQEGGGYTQERDRPETSHSHSPSRSRSRSRTRDRKESRRSRRDRSDSVADRERDDRHHRRHRRKHPYTEEDTQKSRDRSRSASRPDSRRESHRSSRKERESDKRRDRDDDFDRRHRSSHRSHRSRDREHRDRRARDDDRDREKDKDRMEDRKERDRHSHRDRDRDRDHRHPSKKSEPPTPVENSKEFNPPTGPRGSISSSRALDIRGSNLKPRESAPGMAAPSASRRSSQASVRAPSVPSAPMDPHAAERAARDRERLISETRKLAAFGVKRGRDDGEDARRARRKGHRGQIVSVGDEEERMRRMEQEREAARYD